MFPSQLPATRAERWGVLDDLLAAWFPAPRLVRMLGPSELSTAEQRLGLRFPAALQEFYLRYGHRSDVWSLQDTLWMPHELRLERDVLTFCNENQACFRWGIPVEELGSDDPPVVAIDPFGETRRVTENPTLTGFALQFALLNVKFSDGVHYHGDDQGTDEAFDAIAKAYPLLPVPDLHSPVDPTRFHGDDDVIVENGAFTWLWVSARTRPAFDRVTATVRAAGMDPWPVR